MSGHSVPKGQLPCSDLSSGDDNRMLGKLCRHQCLRLVRVFGSLNIPIPQKLPACPIFHTRYLMC